MSLTWIDRGSTCVTLNPAMSQANVSRFHAKPYCSGALILSPLSRTVTLCLGVALLYIAEHHRPLASHFRLTASVPTHSQQAERESQD